MMWTIDDLIAFIESDIACYPEDDAVQRPRLEALLELIRTKRADREAARLVEFDTVAAVEAAGPGADLAMIHIPEAGYYELIWGPEGFKSLTRLGPYGEEAR